MQLVQIKPKHKDLVPFNYLGLDILIPVDHTHVALVKFTDRQDNTNTVIMSFAQKPEFDGIRYSVPKGVGTYLVGQVDDITSTTGSLRSTQPESSEHLLIHNAEELMHKIRNILESDASDKDKIHAIYCPEHGELPQFLDSIRPSLEELFDDEDEDEDLAEQPQAAQQAVGSESGIQQVGPNAFAIKADSPEEIFNVIRSIIQGKLH